MDKLNEIPGFLPDDYDKEPPCIEEMKLTPEQLDCLRQEQKASEDGIALDEYMSAEYDSYIAIGFKKEKRPDNAPLKHEYVCGAWHIDHEDYDAVYEMARLLGYYAFKDHKVATILKKAIPWERSLKDEELNPEPPEHKHLPRDRRFHLNRYNRILAEEFEKVQDEFMDACGDDLKRRTMKMKMVLTAIADQLNDNEPVQVDFFCNFILGEQSEGDNVSGIDIRLRRIPFTWDEAEDNRNRFMELCELLNVPCKINWLID